MISFNKNTTLSVTSNVLFFGLILFYVGIYVFPDGGDIARTFYILIALPSLILFFFLKKEFLKNKYIWLLMLLPIYLTLSHFWAYEENIIRSEFFHLKKLLYIFMFIFSIFYIFSEKPSFLRTLLQFLCVIGMISAAVSLSCSHLSQCGMDEGKRLAGFSVQDFNKFGAIHTIHIGLCLFFLFYGFSQTVKNTIWVKVFLISAIILSSLSVYYAKTHATWFMLIIIAFFALVPKWSLKLFLLLAFLFFCAVLSFFYFDFHIHVLKDNSFAIRLDLAKSALLPLKNNVFFGIGMTHKLPISGVDMEYLLPHPHNIFVDILRFGGVVGLLFFVFTYVVFLVKGMWAANDSVLAKFCLAWFVGGVAIMSVYAQQPVTRPGGYTWFLYWMPIVILAAEIFRVEKKVVSNA